MSAETKVRLDASGQLLLGIYPQAKLVYGADVFWMTEAGATVILDKVLECLQTTRDGKPRGIVEVKL